jgi:hypothetical protein
MVVGFRLRLDETMRERGHREDNLGELLSGFDNSERRPARYLGRMASDAFGSTGVTVSSSRVMALTPRNLARST